MLRQQLQSYFDQTNRNSVVENTMSIRNQFTKVHELVDNSENENKARVEKAFAKSKEIFQSIFQNPKSKIFVLIYEFPEPNSSNASNEYLHSQFSNISKKQLISSKSNSIHIYKTKLENINWQNILIAIANTDLGLDPAIDQKVYFFDIKNDKAFYMYDDRGCLSNDS